MCGGLDPAFFAQGGRELGAELTAEVWSSDARVHAGEGERAADGLGGELDSELGTIQPGKQADLLLRHLMPGADAQGLAYVVTQFIEFHGQ